MAVTTDVETNDGPKRSSSDAFRKEVSTKARPRTPSSLALEASKAGLSIEIRQWRGSRVPGAPPHKPRSGRGPLALAPPQTRQPHRHRRGAWVGTAVRPPASSSRAVSLKTERPAPRPQVEGCGGAQRPAAPIPRCSRERGDPQQRQREAAASGAAQRHNKFRELNVQFKSIRS